jgi:hypothetical protein
MAAMLVLGPSLCGCSSSPPAVDGASFCAEQITAGAAACEAIDPQALEVLLDQAGVCRAIPMLLSSGQITFDSHAAAACLADLKVAPCGSPRATQDCAGAYVGTVPVGGACYQGLAIANECVPGSRCLVATQCPGSCVPYALLGQPCDQAADGSDSCIPPLVCDTTNGCMMPTGGLNPGDPCTAPDAGGFDPAGCPNGFTCTAGTCQAITRGACSESGLDCSLDCVGATPGVPGTCQAYKTRGQACTPGQNECGGGLYCDASQMCVPLPATGQSCAGYDGEGASCLYGFCDQSTTICAAYLQAGDSCQAQPGFFGSGDPCGGLWLACDSVSQVCTPTCAEGNSCGLAGQPCCAGQLCQVGTLCAQGTCAPCGAPGQQCCPVCTGSGTCDPNGPASCSGGACCDQGRICIAEGQTCGSGTGTCQASSCGGCGGSGETCCPGNWCSVAASCLSTDGTVYTCQE